MHCSVCGATVDLDESLVWRCPRATDDDRHHALVFDDRTSPLRAEKSDNPFLAYRRHLALARAATASGLDDGDLVDLITSADSAVATVAGGGFRKTPCSRGDALSEHLGFSTRGGVWIKDETSNVAGSHKARHLFTILLRLLVAEATGQAPWSTASRPPLAIASCGNAAIAAATLAASQHWPISVHVPVSASPDVLAHLERLGAGIIVCPRRDDDPPGDPCIHRFHEAVSGGALPFSVQGTENVWCLDGGRTLGWELIESVGALWDAVVIQVGGGAFASCVGASLRNGSRAPRMYTVQAAGCAPLERAWSRAAENGWLHGVGRRWSECMWAWESEPHSLADGILDDETYDWIGVVEAMAATGGRPVVAPEETIVAAHALAHRATEVDVSPTGSAGLAGVIELRQRGELADDDNVVVVFSGVRR